MDEFKRFASGVEAKGDNQVEKPLKVVEADRDGECAWCREEYKKGDRIALYKSKDEIEFDKNHGGGETSPSPYHNECVDELIAKESEKE